MGDDLERVAVKVAMLGFPLAAARPRPAILDPVIRAAVLTDLALSGALADTGGGLEVDTTPTGFAPADRFLQAVVADPSRSLSWWLTHAPVSVRDIAEVLIARKRWDRHGATRRYRDVNPSVRDAELARLRQRSRRGQVTPLEAATGVLLDVLPLGRAQTKLAPHGSPDLFGAAAWLLPDLLTSLERRKALIDAAGRDAQTAQSASFMF